MKNRLQKTFSFVFKILLFCALWLSLPCIQAYAHTNPFYSDPSGPPRTYSYVSLDSRIYKVDQGIPFRIQCSFVSENSVSSVDYTADGFTVGNDLAIFENHVVGTIFYSGETETPSVTFSVTLNSGKVLMNTVYGYTDSGLIYLSFHSTFGAKDLYWATMIQYGVKTEDDYERYMIGRPKSPAAIIVENVIVILILFFILFSFIWCIRRFIRRPSPSPYAMEEDGKGVL